MNVDGPTMAEPRTVAHLVPSLDPTGPIRVVLDLARHLDRSRYVPVLLPLEVSSRGELVSVSRRLGVEIQPLHSPWWLGGMTELRSALTRTGAGLLHVHCYAPMVLAAGLHLSIPKLISVHNWPWLDYRELHGRLQGRLMWEIERGLLRRFHAVAPCSKTLALELQNRRRGSVTPIQNGVDPERFSPATVGQRAAARRALGIPQDAVVFVYVGKLIPRKRILSVLEGYVGARLENARLLVVGDGPLAPQCNAIAAGRSDIVLTGFLHDTSAMLSAADIYISAAGTEGLPLAVLEAYRAGLRLLLSDIPAHREVLEGEAGAGVLYQSSEDLAMVMRREAGRLPVRRPTANERRRFSSLEMARQYQALYDRLTASPGRSSAGEDSVNEDIESVCGSPS
jgi:glycosyltransferase involved in cell wall biosynthesis